VRKGASRNVPELSDLKNIGRVTARWLNGIGVFSESDLRRLGAVKAYRMIRECESGATLNLLYALQGALMGVHWSRLPEPIKELLEREVARADRR
jgi:DNA transformation protein